MKTMKTMTRSSGLVVSAMAIAMALVTVVIAADGNLTTQEAETLGPNSSSGSLKVLVIEQEEDYSSLANPEFTLEAQTLRVETDRSEASTFQTRLLPETETDEYYQPVIEGLYNRENYQFSVWSIDSGATLQAEDASCASLIPSERNDITRRPLIQDPEIRASNHAETAESLRWKGCDRATTLTVRGDFLLRLWEWDAELTTKEETRILRSGTQNHEQLPAIAPDASGFFGQSRELYLFANNATLTIPRLGEHYELYLDDVEATAASGFRMSATTGSILGFALDRQDLFIAGDDLNLQTKGTGMGTPLETKVDGTIHRIEIDGKAVETTSPPGEEKPGWLLPFTLFALTAAGAALLIGTVVWHTNADLRMAVISPLMKRRNNLFDEAVTEATEYSIDRPRQSRKWATIAMRLKPNHPEALAAMGTVHFHRREYKKALQCFQRAIVNVEADFDPTIRPEETIPMWAVYCARSLGGMRVETRSPEERDMLGEKVLWYARIAAQMDPIIAQGLLKDGYISDLWDPIRTMMELERHGVTR